MDGAADHAEHAENPVARGVQRVWLDWNEPCLPAAAAWLTAQAGATGLGHWLAVTPGRRAGRRLLEALLDHAGRDAVEPPELLTPAQAIDALLALDVPLATPEECLWAWVRTLAEADHDQIDALLPRRPDADDVNGWLALARACRRRVEDLAAGCLRPADVVPRVADVDRPEEPERWRTLARMDDAVRRRLAAVGLVDPVEARQTALRERRVRGDRPIVLVGVTELTPLLRAVLLESAASITALVHAPSARADDFDAFGAVQIDAWADERNIVPDEAIEVAADPTDQAARMLDALARIGAGRSPESVTIGVADEEPVDGLRLAAAAAGLSVHAAAGRPLERTGPYRLLAAWRDWLRTGTASAFAVLVRHPDLTHVDVAREAIDWLMREFFLDDIAHDRALAAIEDIGLDVIDTPWEELDRDARDRQRATTSARTVRRTVARFEGMAAGLRGPAVPAATWAAGILGVLEKVYGDLDAGDEHHAPTVDACVRLRDALARFARAAEGLVPDLAPATALDGFLRNLAGETVPDRAEAGQIEMLGWLELHLDPAPALVLTGVREGTLPESVEGDFLLPDGLRQRLGLACNRSRLARDAYLLSAIVHAREALAVIAPRQGAGAEANRPSRLLLAVDDDHLVARVRRLCVTSDDAATTRVILPGGAGPAPGSRSRFEVAVKDLHTLLPPFDPPDSMSVTEFRAYLACPFRYALQHRLNLDLRPDAEVELDARGFGSLTHEVLEAFGNDPGLRDADDAGIIADGLSRLLDRAVTQRYRDVLTAGALIQIERVRQRLAGFAVRQAEERRAGWRIVHTEFKCEKEVGVPAPDGAPMPLRGRIDRIDVHPDLGSRILDYKTSDSPKKPEVACPRSGWIDLQLPLYRLIGREHPGLDLPRPIGLGYVVLPKKPIETAFMLANWNDDVIESGIERAGEVVEQIRAGAFEANEEFSGRNDDWERICRTNVLADEVTLLENYS